MSYGKQEIKKGKIDYDCAKCYDILPRYPKTVYEYFDKIYNMKNKVIADIGCGTGRLTIDFLEMGNTVYAIDPEESMRSICKEKCKKFNDKIILIDGTESNMNINDKSVDFVIVSQAYHKFDPKLFKSECKRVLKENGKVLIMWYRINYNNKIYSQMLSNIKGCYKEYKTRYGLLSEFEGSVKEEKENIESAIILFENKYEINETMCDIELNLDEFKNLGLSMELFPISNSLMPKIADSKEFNKEKYISNLENIFKENAIDNKIKLPFKIQVVNNKGEL